MELLTEQRGGVTVVTLPRIPLDRAFVSELERDLGALQANAPKLVLDLRRVLFIDSAGVGALVDAVKRTRDAGGEIRFSGPTAQVKAVLDVVKLEKLVEIRANVDDAVAAFGA